jgi:hypothetical protein
MNEATLVFEYSEGTVELYTTRRCDFEAALKRNPNPLVKEELNPGYRLVYSLDGCAPIARTVRKPLSDERRAALRVGVLSLRKAREAPPALEVPGEEERGLSGAGEATS